MLHSFFRGEDLQGGLHCQTLGNQRPRSSASGRPLWPRDPCTARRLDSNRVDFDVACWFRPLAERMRPRAINQIFEMILRIFLRGQYLHCGLHCQSFGNQRPRPSASARPLWPRKPCTARTLDSNGVDVGGACWARLHPRFRGRRHSGRGECWILT